ncbi:MAG TPA: hypothetical protein VFP49_13120 [Nitrososphaeraceae archaeon]|nr:hypothetical protein [Nitrososphaeraceae archaeon]
MNTSITLFFLMSTLVMLALPFANLPIFSNVMAEDENSYNNYEKSEKYDHNNDNYGADSYQPYNYENGYGYNNDSYGYNNNDAYGYNNNDAYGYKDKDKTPKIFPANKVSELGDRWWQWIASLNNITDVNPFTDTGQAGCDVGLQDDGRLLFLVGSPRDATGNFPEHECGIPAGTSILFPIVNVICDSLEVNTPFFGADETSQRICANNLTNTFANLTVNIDGIEVQNPEQYRIDSPAGGFSLTAVAGNPVGIPAGNGTGVQDGFWILLKPLKPGEHTITFSGILDLPQIPGFTNIVEAGATYFLDVQSDEKSHPSEEYRQDYPIY